MYFENDNFIKKYIIFCFTGENWVAACTDARIVRIFSLGGTQRFLFSIPGPVVVMSAHTDQLFIVYHLTQGKQSKLYQRTLLKNLTGILNL